MCVTRGLYVQGIRCHRSDHDFARATHLIVPTLCISYTRIQQAASDTIWPGRRICNRLFVVAAPLVRHPGDQCKQQSIFAWEVMQQPAFAHAGLFRDGIERERPDAITVNHDLGSVENRITRRNFGVAGFAFRCHAEVYRLAGRQTNRLDGLQGKSLLSCGLPVFPLVV